MVKESDSVDRKIKTFKRALEEKFNISKIVLFGSYAKGNQQKDSDIDVAVICDDFKDRDRIELTKLLLGIAQSVDVNFEPLGYSEEEYKNCDNRTFLAEIKRHGIEY